MSDGRSFTPRALRLEVLANLRASPLRTLITVVVAFLVGAGLATTTVLDVNRIGSHWSEMSLAGQYVDVIRVADPAGMPAQLCDALSTIDGVRSAGGITSTHRDSLAQSPDQVVEIITATPGYFAVAWPTAPASVEIGAVAGSELFASSGVVSGAIVHLAGAADGRTSLSIGWNADRRARIDGINGAIVVPAPAGDLHTKECFVEYEPGAETDASKLVQSWFPASLGPLSSDFLPPSDLVSDPEKDLASRPSRLGWGIAGGFLGILMLSFWWSQRHEVGLYRILGLTRPKLTCMYAIEVFIVVLIAFQAGFTGAVLIQPPVFEATWVALVLDNLRSLALLVLLPVVGLLATGFRSSVALLRDH